MARKMTVDFYTVETPLGNPPFEESLKAIDLLGRGINKNFASRDGQFIRMQVYRRRGGLTEADMLRIRMEDMPRKANLAGDVDALDLKDDEGLGEETALLYDDHTRLLLLQRNRHGVSASALTSYVSNKVGHTRPYVLLPVLDPDVMARVQRLGDVRKFAIRVTGTENAELLGKAATEFGFTRLNHVMDNFKAPMWRSFSRWGRAEGPVRSMFTGQRASFGGCRRRFAGLRARLRRSKSTATTRTVRQRSSIC